MQLDFCFDDIRIVTDQRQRKTLHHKLPKLIAMYGTICYLCNQEMVVGVDQLHVDHKKPWIHGGTDEWRNLRPVHAFCNLYRHDMPLNDPRLPEKISEAWQNVLWHRTHPNKHECIDCGIDILDRRKDAIVCKACKQARMDKRAVEYLCHKLATDSAYRAQ